MSSVNWVHISDLHFGCSEGVSTKLFRLDAADYLYKYYVSIGQRPDYLFITGDIIFPKGNKRNITGAYAEARDFIDGIAHKLNIPRNCIFMVPGNHDVSNEGTRFNVAQKMRVSGNYDYSRGEVISAYSKEWRKLKPRKQFLDLYQEICSDTYHHNHCLFHKEHVDILCLDTSLLSIGSTKDNGQLFIGSNKVFDELRRSPKEKPVIVLAHHPLSFMKSIESSKLVRIFELHNVFAYLYGHTHSFGLELPSVLGNPTAPSGIDAICCPTHMDESDPDGLATVVGLLTGIYDTKSKRGFATYHIWPTGSDSTVPKLIELPLFRKKKREIQILDETNEKISKAIRGNFENAPYTLTEKVIMLFEEGMAQLDKIAAHQLRSMKEELLVRTINVPTGDASGGRSSSNLDADREFSETDLENTANEEKQLRNIKDNDL